MFFTTEPKNSPNNGLKFKNAEKLQNLNSYFFYILYKEKCSENFFLSINKLTFVETWAWTLSKN